MISGIILFAIGALYSLIKGWLSDSETIPEAFLSVFTYKINIWIAIAVAILFMISTGVLNRIRNKKTPVPPFVKDFTWGVYQGQKWTWRWQWSRTNHFYYITDLSIVCPACKQGLLTLGYIDYKCGKCEADIPYNCLNTTNGAVENQILEDARKQYDYCKEYIGKLTPGIIKQ